MRKQSKGSVATHSQGYHRPKADSILCVATHSQCYRGPKAEGIRESRTPADRPTGAWPLEGTVTVNLCLPITSSQCDPAVSMQSSGSSSKETPPGAGFQRRP